MTVVHPDVPMGWGATATNGTVHPTLSATNDVEVRGIDSVL